MEPGLRYYQNLFGRDQGSVTIDRGSLPTPLHYLKAHDLLTRKPRAEWAVIRCPVHKGGEEKQPSLSVSLIDGHFRCHTCGAKGGDIVALHRLITHLGFRAAVLDLGGRFHE